MSNVYLTKDGAGQSVNSPTTSSIGYGATGALTINSTTGVSFCNNAGTQSLGSVCSISSTGVLNCSGLTISGPLICTSLVVPVGGMICNGTITCNNGLTISGTINASNATISVGAITTGAITTGAITTSGVTMSTQPIMNYGSSFTAITNQNQIGYVYDFSSGTGGTASITTTSTSYRLYTLPFPINAGMYIVQYGFYAYGTTTPYTCYLTFVGTQNTYKTLTYNGTTCTGIIAGVNNTTSVITISTTDTFIIIMVCFAQNTGATLNMGGGGVTLTRIA